jgi:hypothetical protein
MKSSPNIGLNIPEGNDVFDYKTFLVDNLTKIDSYLSAGGSGGGVSFESLVDGETITIDTSTVPTTDTLAPVLTINPNGNTFATTQTVTLSTNETATIYYTLDGSIPTEASAVYTAPLSLSTTTVLKAFAKDTAGNTSAVQIATFTLDAAAPDTIAPMLTLTAAATFTDTKTITMTANETATIWYTLDGSDPKTSGTKLQYSTPITLSNTTTVKAYAVDTATNESSVQTVTYTKQAASGAVIYPENGYLVMPVNQFTWASISGYTDTGFIGVASTAILTTPTGLLDTTNATAILSTEYPYRTWVANMPNSSYPYECSTIIPSGSSLGKAVLKVATSHGATAAEIASYLASSNLTMKLKLGANYKTLSVTSNVSTFSTRTSGVDTVNFEYAKVTLVDGIGDYLPPDSSTKYHYCSNGFKVSPAADYVFSRTYKNIRVNADGTLEMLLPKGTLTSMDLAGVISYLSSANLKIYYA